MVSNDIDPRPSGNRPLMAEPWREPLDPRPPKANPYARAAVLIWLVGTFELLLFGLLTTVLVAMASVNEPTIHDAVASGAMTQEQSAIFLHQQPQFTPRVVTVVILGLLPAILCLVLGFFIRAGGRIAVMLALLITITQTTVIGVLFLGGLLWAATSGQPTVATLNILFFGSLLILLGVAIYWLIQARHARSPFAAHPSAKP